jgi:hypothetical protein
MRKPGDVLIAAVPSLSQAANRQLGTILARGELTGHSHSIDADETAALWGCDGVLCLNVVAARTKSVSP